MRALWSGRIVLGIATMLLARIALKCIVDPVGAVAGHGITLGSAEAMTIMRVSGGVFLGIALVLVGCFVAERRLPVGLAVLVVVAGAITGVRLLGLAVDGPAQFTLAVLRPEIALVASSSVAFVLERRRVRSAVGRSG